MGSTGTSVPENPGKKGRKVALNTPATPSRPLTDGDQLFLGSTEEKSREGASQIAAFARDAMRENEVSLSTLGTMIGKDATAAHRALDVEDPPAAFRVLVALLLLDKRRTWIRHVAQFLGGEFEDRPELDDAEFRRRVEAHARQSKSGTAWLDEALERTP